MALRTGILIALSLADCAGIVICITETAGADERKRAICAAAGQLLGAVLGLLIAAMIR